MTATAVAEPRNRTRASLFDFHRNWNYLTHRPADNEPVIDGVRAIAILWVIAIHFAFFHLGTLPKQVVAIFSNPWTTWIGRGDLGVDLFFVISGLLMGQILFAEFQKSGTIVFRRFYLRRFLRLIPVYVAAMILGVYLLHNVPVTSFFVQFPPWGNLQNVWTNLLYVNNFVPVAKQYMGWCWSLAIEEQFYLLLPASILAFMAFRKARISVLVGMMLLSAAISFGIIYHYGFLPPYTDSPAQASWGYRFDVSYDKLYTRFGALLAGVAGAYLSVFCTPQLKRFFSRAGLVNALALISLVAIAHIGSIAFASPFFKTIPPIAAELWWAVHRDVLALATIFLILAAIHSPSLLSRGVRRVLSWNGFYPVAQISYSLYLVHEMVFMWLFPKTAPLFAPYMGPYGAMVADSALGFVLSCGISAGLYVAIERPSILARTLPSVQEFAASFARPTVAARSPA